MARQVTIRGARVPSNPPSLRLELENGTQVENIDLGSVFPTNASTKHLRLVNKGGPFSGTIRFFVKGDENAFSVYVDNDADSLPIDVTIEFFGDVQNMSDLGTRSASLVIEAGDQTITRRLVGRINPFNKS